MLSKKIEYIFVFVIVFVSFNITCMNNNSTCNSISSVDYEKILEKFDITYKGMVLADIKQRLLEFFGEDVDIPDSQKVAARRVIAFLSSSNYEDSDAFRKLIVEEPKNEKLNKYAKLEKDPLIVKAFIEKYKDESKRFLEATYPDQKEVDVESSEN